MGQTLSEPVVEKVRTLTPRSILFSPSRLEGLELKAMLPTHGFICRVSPHTHTDGGRMSHLMHPSSVHPRPSAAVRHGVGTCKALHTATLSSFSVFQRVVWSRLTLDCFLVSADIF